MKIIRLIIISLLAGFLLAGCATTGESGAYDEKPWTAPESWEQGNIGIPF